MSLYAERIENFNRSLESAREHAQSVASQVENLQGINRDPTKSLFNKVNDTVGVVSGTIGQAAQIYHTYKHGKVLTFLEQHDINEALGKAGNGGLKNAGNETLNTIDQARNAPRAGLAPNSGDLQLPKANELVSSLKGRVIGNESELSSPADLGQLVGRTTALQDKADNISQDDVNNILSTNAPRHTGAEPPVSTPQGGRELAPEVETNLDDLVAAREAAGRQPPALPAEAGEDVTRNFLSRPLPAEGAGKVLADAEQPIGSSLLGEAAEALQPIKINTNAISGGEESLQNVANIGEDVAGGVSKAKNIAGGIGKAVSNTLGKFSGEGGGEALGDSVAAGMEAAAPETGAAAPLVAAVGGLVALGTTIAGIFHKNKPPPPVVAPPPPAAAQIGADLSVSK